MEELKSNQVKSATTGISNDGAFFATQGYGENDSKAENTALKLENEGLKEKIKKLEEGTAVRERCLLGIFMGLNRAEHLRNWEQWRMTTP